MKKYLRIDASEIGSNIITAPVDKLINYIINTYYSVGVTSISLSVKCGKIIVTTLNDSERRVVGVVRMFEFIMSVQSYDSPILKDVSMFEMAELVSVELIEINNERKEKDKY